MKLSAVANVDCNKQERSTHIRKLWGVATNYGEYDIKQAVDEMLPAKADKPTIGQ